MNDEEKKAVITKKSELDSLIIQGLLAFVLIYLAFIQGNLEQAVETCKDKPLTSFYKTQ